jgi:hypothetical protein
LDIDIKVLDIKTDFCTESHIILSLFLSGVFDISTITDKIEKQNIPVTGRGGS